MLILVSKISDSNDKNSFFINDMLEPVSNRKTMYCLLVLVVGRTNKENSFTITNWMETEFGSL